METIDFNQLEYGCYALEYTNGVYSEAVRYSSADFNKLYVRKIRLPDGKGNLIYLLSDSFTSAVNMISNDNFVIPPMYKKVYYPIRYMGTVLGRKFRVLVSGKEKTQRDDEIKTRTKRSVWPGRVLYKTPENVFFITSDIYKGMKPIIQAYPLKKAYTTFWSQFVSIINSISPEKNEKGTRLLIIDCDSFGFGAGPLKDAKGNPLYLLYMAYLRNRNLSVLNCDIDMLICSKNLFLKFNPAKATMKEWNVFKRALFKIMKSDLDAYTDSLSDEDKKEVQEADTDKTVSAAVSKAIDPYVKNTSTATKVAVQDVVETKLRETAAKKLALNKEINKAVSRKPEPEKNMFMDAITDYHDTQITSANPVKSPLTKKQMDLFTKVSGGYDMLASDTGMEYDDDYENEDEYEDEEDTTDEEEVLTSDEEETIQNDVQDILVSDDDVKSTILNEIQQKNEPVKGKISQVNSARDEKLREEQKKVIVKNTTIEELLTRDTENASIEEWDKSAVMHTANQNMKHIKFANFEKTYLDKLYARDIVSCFDMLKDKDNPFFITGIKIEDTSTPLDFKETWTVSLKDQFGKNHTMKVDIPRFKDNKFMLINGTKYMILKQNFYKPLVKDTPDTVILTTNFNKVTITRVATKSLASVERIFSLIKKSHNTEMFVTGNSADANKRFISTLEYDELSKQLFKFVSGSTEISFSRKWINEHWADKIPNDIRGNEFYIGHEGKAPILINEDTGLDRSGRTIIDIIAEHLPEKEYGIFSSIKAGKQSMYVDCKMAGENIPIIAALIVWNGLRKSLDMMGVEWKWIDGFKRSQIPDGWKYIKFQNGFLTYAPQTFAELILNGMLKMHPEDYDFEDYENETGYEEYMYSQWGSYNGINEVRSFNEFLVDPITKSVCHDINLPDTPSELLIYAAKMLCDNDYNSKASDKSYRVRSIEIVPGILYSMIAQQYKAYVASGRTIPFTLKQRCVMGWLKSGVGVEAYSTLNPVVEVNRSSTISPKGYRGTNKDRSYDEEKRSYDPSSVGKIAISTSAKPSYALAE